MYLKAEYLIKNYKTFHPFGWGKWERNKVKKKNFVFLCQQPHKKLCNFYLWCLMISVW